MDEEFPENNPNNNNEKNTKKEHGDDDLLLENDDDDFDMDDDELILGDDDEEDDFLNIYEKNIRDQKRREQRHQRGGITMRSVSADGTAQIITHEEVTGLSSDDDDDDDVLLKDLENGNAVIMMGNRNNSNNNNNQNNNNRNVPTTTRLTDQSRNDRVIDDIEDQYVGGGRRSMSRQQSSSTARASSVGSLSLADLTLEEVLGGQSNNNNNNNNNQMNNNDNLGGADFEAEYEQDEDEMKSRRKRKNDGTVSPEIQHNAVVDHPPQQQQQQQRKLKGRSALASAMMLDDDKAVSERKQQQQQLDANSEKLLIQAIFVKQVAEIFRESGNHEEFFVRNIRSAIEHVIDFHKKHDLPEPTFTTVEHLLTTSLVSEGFICKLGDLVDQANAINQEYQPSSFSSSASNENNNNNNNNSSSSNSTSSSSFIVYDQQLGCLQPSQKLLQLMTNPNQPNSWRKFTTLNPWNVSRILDSLEAVPQLLDDHQNQQSSRQNSATTTMNRLFSKQLPIELEKVISTMRKQLAPFRTNPERHLVLERRFFSQNNNSKTGGILDDEEQVSVGGVSNLTQQQPVIPRKTFTYPQLMLFKTDISLICGGNSIKAKSTLLRELAHLRPERWDNNLIGGGGKNNNNTNNKSKNTSTTNKSSFTETDIILNELHARDMIYVFRSPNCEWICPIPNETFHNSNNNNNNNDENNELLKIIPPDFARKFLSPEFPVHQTLTQESFRAFLSDFKRVMFGSSSGSIQQSKLRAEVLDDLDQLGWKTEKISRFILNEFVKTNVISQVRKPKNETGESEDGCANSSSAFSVFVKYNSTLFENAVSQQQAQKEVSSSFYAAATSGGGSGNNNQQLNNTSNNNANSNDNSSVNNNNYNNYNNNNNNFVDVKNRFGESIFVPRRIFIFLQKVERVFQTLGPQIGVRSQPAAAVICGLFAMNEYHEMKGRLLRRGIRSLLSFRLLKETSEVIINPKDGKRMLSVTFELQTPFDPIIGAEILKDSRERAAAAAAARGNLMDQQQNNHHPQATPHTNSPLSGSSSIVYHHALPDFLHNRMLRFEQEQKRNLSFNTKRKLLFFRRGEFMDWMISNHVFDHDEMRRIHLLFFMWELQQKKYFEQNVTLTLPVKPFVIAAGSSSQSPGRNDDDGDVHAHHNNNNLTLASIIGKSNAVTRALHPHQQYVSSLSYRERHEVNELVRANTREESSFGGFETIVSNERKRGSGGNGGEQTVALLQITREEFELLDQSIDAGKVLLWLRRLFLRRSRSHFLQEKIVMMVKFDFSYLTTQRVLDALDILVDRRFIIREFTGEKNHLGMKTATSYAGKAIISIPEGASAGAKPLQSYSEMVAALPENVQYLLRDIRYIILEGVKNPSPLKSTLARELRWRKWSERDIQDGLRLLEQRYFIQELHPTASTDGSNHHVANSGPVVVLRDPGLRGKQTGNYASNFVPPEIHIVSNNNNNNHNNDSNNTAGRRRGRAAGDHQYEDTSNWNVNASSSAPNNRNNNISINSNTTIPLPASQQQQQQQQQNPSPLQQPPVYYYNFYAQQHLPYAPDPETYRKYGSNYYRNPLHIPPPLKCVNGRVIHRPGYDPNAATFIPIEQRMSPCKTPPPSVSHF